MFEQRAKVLLLVSFTLLGIATATAYLDPATGYELSIYTATPASFWLFASFALLVSLVVVFSASSRRIRLLGALLGGVGMTTIVSLPLVRGYYFVDETDALSHLGTAMEMQSGLVPFTGSRYPIVHTLGLAVTDASGLPVRHALLLLVVAYVVCFFVFVPLVTRELTGGGWTTYIALYSGFLLLPINHLAPSYRVHPTSQAILYAPVFVLVFFLLYKRRSLRHTGLFLLLAPTYVMLHPQQAANLLAFFGVVVGLQVLYDAYEGQARERFGEWLVPELAFYAVTFWLWVRTLPVFQQNTEQVFETLAGQLQVGQSTAARSGSLDSVGGSLPEVFMKLFFVSLLYILLTGVTLAVVLRGIRRAKSQLPAERLVSDGGTDRPLSLFVFAGLVPIGVLFVLYFLGGISDQYFRHLGMLAVFATVLGAIGLGLLFRYVRDRQSRTAARRALALVLVLVTALSLPVVFTSPYIYDSSNHVTEAQVQGYETTFEHRSEGIVYDDVRSPVYRYWNALQRGERPEGDLYYQECPDGIPDHFANRSLRAYYDEPVYIPVTGADRVRDPIIWEGFRFSSEDFDYLEAAPGIDRVQSNGEYTLYLVEPSNATRATGADETCVVQ